MIVEECGRSKETQLSTAVDTLKSAIRNDPDYAWGWQSNIAMSFVDQGGSREAANRAAANFLHMFADVDMTKHPHWDIPPKDSESDQSAQN